MQKCAFDFRGSMKRDIILFSKLPAVSYKKNGTYFYNIQRFKSTKILNFPKRNSHPKVTEIFEIFIKLRTLL